MPGGYVEPGESPRQAAAREVNEELGLNVMIGSMLAVDWAPSEKEGDKMLFLFAGADLPGNVTFRFADGEIDEARYLHVDELEQYTIDRLARRIRSTVLADEATYLEHGEAMITTAP